MFRDGSFVFLLKSRDSCPATLNHWVVMIDGQGMDHSFLEAFRQNSKKTTRKIVNRPGNGTFIYTNWGRVAQDHLCHTRPA
jgi:hypothetical protein